jgi:hypothetical protein
MPQTGMTEYKTKKQKKRNPEEKGSHGEQKTISKLQHNIINILGSRRRYIHETGTRC